MLWISERFSILNITGQIGCFKVCFNIWVYMGTDIEHVQSQTQDRPCRNTYLTSLHKGHCKTC